MLNRKNIFRVLVLTIGLMVSEYAQAQIIENTAATITTDFHNLNNGVCENVLVSVPAGHTDEGTTLPSCNSTISTITQDSWFHVVSNTTGVLAFSITPTANADLAIAVYDGANQSNDAFMLNCSNRFTGSDLSTETVLISTISGNTYTVRLMNRTTASGTAYDSRLSVYPGPVPQRDLCVNAVTVALGTCDFAFSVDNGFVHNENNTTTIGGKTMYADGWLKIDLAQNKRIRVEYTNSNKDAFIEAYTGSCGALSLIATGNTGALPSQTVDLVTGFAASEALEFEASLLGTNTYYIRIGNVADSETMTGEVCIEEVVVRDACGNIEGATPPHSAEIKLGDCGVRVSVYGTFDGLNTGSCAVGAQNVWARYVASTTTRVRLELSSESSSDVAFSVRTGADCASLSTEVVCRTLTSASNASASFNVTAGTIYYIEIGDNTSSSWSGFLCLYEAAKKSEDVFYGANVLDQTGLDCGKNFNLTASFENNGVEGASMTGLPTSGISCVGSNITSVVADAWGAFQVTSVPTEGLLVEYDNNDGRVNNTPPNAGLQVYRGGTIQTAGSVSQSSCVVVTASGTNVNLNTFVKNFLVNEVIGTPAAFDLTTPPPGAHPCYTVSNMGFEKWVRYQHNTSDGVVRVAFKSSTTATVNYAVGVYSSGVNCVNVFTDNQFLNGDLLSCGSRSYSDGHDGEEFEEMATAEFSAVNGSVYYIRVLSGASISGDFSVNYAPSLFLMGCSNSIVEGTESVLLTGASFTNNTQYYFRVMRLDGASTLNGTACIRNNSIPQGDICANATGLLVGDCDIEFDLTGDNIGEDKFVNNQTVPPSGFSGTIGRDGWISFTATTSQTTVEYSQSSTTANVVLEVYRGNCASLNRINDAVNNQPFVNDIVLGATGVEKFVINSVPGTIYFVRIIKEGTSSNLNGTLCIYNTVARDACIDNDLLTLNVGDCHRTLDIPRSFDSDIFGSNVPPLYRDFSTNLPVAETGGSLVQFTQTHCETNPSFSTATNNNWPQNSSRDGWFRLLGNGNEVTITYSYSYTGMGAATALNSSNPSIAVYTALRSVGPVNCGTGLNGANNPFNQYACANNFTTFGTQTESVTFRTNGGQQYLVRIIDLSASVGKDMTGLLCISDGRNDYNTPCASPTTTGPRAVNIGNCSVPLNVLSTGVASCSSPAITIAGGNFDDDNGGTSCDNCVNRDAWAIVTRPYVCDPTLAAPSPSVHTFGDGTQVISCARPYRVNLGTDGAIGGVGAAADKCECGTNATNNCSAPLIELLPAPVALVCPAGYYCYDAAGVGTTCDVCVPNGYTYNVGKNAVYDSNVFDDYLVPTPTFNGTNWVCPNPYSYDSGSASCVCAQQTIRNLPSYNSFTIEYDNRNGVSEIAADYSMLVYQTTNCDNENNYTRLACLYNPAPNVERVEKHTVTGLSTAHNAGGETYYVRILNKSITKTLLGNLCTYYGSDLANPSCFTFPLNDYGELEGEFKNYTVPNETADANRNLPTTTIPNCVLPGGSNPTSMSPNPIRSDAWMQFTVPANSTYSGVSVQFDNASSPTLRNVSIAIYTAPEIPTGTTNVRDNGTTNLTLNCRPYGAADPNPANNPNRGGLFLLDCQNAVLSGTETSTINTTYTNGAQPAASTPTNTSIARTYYVRVMNVHNETNPTAFVGRIRVFPAAACNLDTEMVEDGDFGKWPSITYTPTTPNNQAQNAATFDAARNTGRINIPNITTNDPYPNDIDGVFLPLNINTGVARFATDYGYIREGGTYSINPGQTGTYANFASGRGEFGPEGLYTVRHSPWTLKDDWFCFGVGYSGYGGRTGGGEPAASYCQTGGGGFGNEPCQVVTLENTVTTTGAYNVTTDRPAHFPSASDANFLIANGSYNPAGGLPPGKIWCQTVGRATADVPDVSYYLFSIWVQNMISGGRNLDVPQMRLTVCDMENPSSPGSLPAERDLYSTANGDGGADNVRMTRLPGVTDVSTSTSTFDASNPYLTNGFGKDKYPEENAAQRVRHLPRPGNNRLFALVSTGTRPPSYGAAMTCNLTQGNGYTGTDNVNESLNARLKVLGASFLVPERPDNWVIIRCVYRAPRNVREMNLCIENLSLTKNGNDLAVDKISFRKCESADAETFDRLLKGDPCALSTDGKVTGIPLFAALMEFSGELLGDKVALNWATTNEQNMSHYRIERSIDGITFSPIGSKDAQNGGQGYNNYRWYDTNLPVGVKTLYYRLMMVDNKGLEKNTSIVTVEVPALEAFDLKLKPNPIERGGEFTLQFHALQAGQASVIITDMVGNRLMRQIVQVKGGDEELTFKAGNLKAGLYIVQMTQGGKIATKKLVIQ
jgi:hypothetical protein